MNLRGVLFLLGRLLLTLTAALLVPAAVAYFLGEAIHPFLTSAIVAGVLGITLQQVFRQPGEFRFGRREAFVLVTAAWVTASCVGALPYILHKGPHFLVNALFESASGFTTTGATILADVESEPGALMLWRSLTQWLGGMGIIVLGIAILPKLAVGGMELLGAEAPGPTPEKLTPRIAQTAKYLWVIYALFTLAAGASLFALGMSPLDAVNHAMTSVATAGFSTNNASVGGFDSAAIEMVVMFFMILSAANFALHFHLLRGRPGPLLRDPEFRFFVGVLVAGTLLLAGDLLGSHEERSILNALRLGAFQATSILTTTGFTTADFDSWPSFSRALLLLFMFVGGCAGSTSGSVKVARIIIVAKKLARDLRRLVQPHAVLPVRIGSRAVPDEVVSSVTTFFILFLVLFAVGGLALTLMGLDPVSAFGGSAACIGNIGPAFGLLGPTQTYALLPAPAKLMLVALMIVGRLELYTVLVLLFLRRR